MDGRGLTGNDGFQQFVSGGSQADLSRRPGSDGDASPPRESLRDGQSDQARGEQSLLSLGHMDRTMATDAQLQWRPGAGNLVSLMNVMASQGLPPGFKLDPGNPQHLTSTLAHAFAQFPHQSALGTLSALTASQDQQSLMQTLFSGAVGSGQQKQELGPDLGLGSQRTSHSTAALSGLMNLGLQQVIQAVEAAQHSLALRGGDGQIMRGDHQAGRAEMPVAKEASGGLSERNQQALEASGGGHPRGAPGARAGLGPLVPAAGGAAGGSAGASSPPHASNSGKPSGRPSPSRYESQKRRDWNTFGQYLKNHNPPIIMARCTATHVVGFMRYLDQFGKTRVHNEDCEHFGQATGNPQCICPMKQAWGSLDSLIGRLRAAYEENGGPPETNPFGSRTVRLYLREIRESQARARGIPYEKRKRRRGDVIAGGGEGN